MPGHSGLRREVHNDPALGNFDIHGGDLEDVWSARPRVMLAAPGRDVSSALQRVFSIRSMWFQPSAFKAA